MHLHCNFIVLFILRTYFSQIINLPLNRKSQLPSITISTSIALEICSVISQMGHLISWTLILICLFTTFFFTETSPRDLKACHHSFWLWRVIVHIIAEYFICHSAFSLPLARKVLLAIKTYLSVLAFLTQASSQSPKLDHSHRCSFYVEVKNRYCNSNHSILRNKGQRRGLRASPLPT